MTKPNALRALEHLESARVARAALIAEYGNPETHEQLVAGFHQVERTALKLAEVHALLAIADAVRGGSL